MWKYQPKFAEILVLSMSRTLISLIRVNAHLFVLDNSDNQC